MDDVKKAAADAAQTVDKGLEEASKAVRSTLAWALAAAKDGLNSGAVLLDSGKVRGVPFLECCSAFGLTTGAARRGDRPGNGDLRTDARAAPFAAPPRAAACAWPQPQPPTRAEPFLIFAIPSFHMKTPHTRVDRQAKVDEAVGVLGEQQDKAFGVLKREHHAVAPPPPLGGTQTGRRRGRRPLQEPLLVAAGRPAA